MSNVTRIDRTAHDVNGAAREAEANDVKQGITVGFTESGDLFFSGFGGISMERSLFMMEAVKYSIFKDS